jgi:hypothetical protein
VGFRYLRALKRYRPFSRAEVHLRPQRAAHLAGAYGRPRYEASRIAHRGRAVAVAVDSRIRIPNGLDVRGASGLSLPVKACAGLCVVYWEAMAYL